jgi:hypothetical protein
MFTNHHNHCWEKHDSIYEAEIPQHQLHREIVLRGRLSREDKLTISRICIDMASVHSATNLIPQHAGVQAVQQGRNDCEDVSE